MVEKLQYNDEVIELYAPDSLNFVTEKIPEILSKKIEEYKGFFSVDNFRKMKVIIFDDLEKFREYVYSLRGERESLPDYSRGVFDDGNIILSYDDVNTLLLGYNIYNHSVDFNDYTKEQIDYAFNRYVRCLKNPSHETFHIMYEELVWKKKGLERVVWFDEGMAQYFSDEMNGLLEDKHFKDWFIRLKTNTKVIPNNLNELDHGDSFSNENYNGYQLSYLSVRYLIESLGIDEFKRLISDITRIKEYGNHVLNDALTYYDKKFNLVSNPNPFIDVNNLDCWTKNTNQNEMGKSLLELSKEIGPINTIDDLKRIDEIFYNKFVRDKEKIIVKFKRTSEEIAESKIYSGCSDVGTVLAPILRQNGLPTVYIQTAYLPWIKSYQENNPDSKCIQGHIFLGVYIEKQWVLLDVPRGYIFLNVDINSDYLPDGYIAFTKSLNGHEVGFDSPNNNTTIMRKLFESYDISNYVEPSYDRIITHDKKRQR